MERMKRRVEEIMQCEVATLSPDERLDLADDVMRLGRVRHMPVLDGRHLVGLVSNRDLMAASLSRVLDFAQDQRRTFMRSIEVGEVMTRAVVTVRPDTSIREAAREMIGHQIGCLPVTSEDGNLLGLITETDLLRAAFLELPSAEPTELEVDDMSDLGDKLSEEIEALKQVRDELRVKIHLGAAEARDAWEQLEKKWNELEAKAKQVSREAEQPLQDIGEAARDLANEIRAGYRRIRDAL